MFGIFISSFYSYSVYSSLSSSTDLKDHNRNIITTCTLGGSSASSIRVIFRGRHALSPEISGRGHCNGVRIFSRYTAFSLNIFIFRRISFKEFDYLHSSRVGEASNPGPDNYIKKKELVNEIRASLLRSTSHRRPPLPPSEAPRAESPLMNRELDHEISTSHPPPSLSPPPLPPPSLSPPGTPPSESALLSQVTRGIHSLQGEAFPEETRSIPDTISLFGSIDDNSELASDSLDRYSHFRTVSTRCSTCCSFRYHSTDITIPLQLHYFSCFKTDIELHICEACNFILYEVCIIRSSLPSNFYMMSFCAEYGQQALVPFRCNYIINCKACEGPISLHMDACLCHFCGNIPYNRCFSESDSIRSPTYITDIRGDE